MTEGICIRILKPGEEVWIGAVRVIVMESALTKVKLAIQAPPEEKIEIVKRQEVSVESL